jgi:NADPH:quinone reductase-like Zn-dependent oxidoreductase
VIDQRSKPGNVSEIIQRTMRAIRFHSLGGPEVVQHEEVDEAPVSAGKVLVRVRAAGVNIADTRF